MANGSEIFDQLRYLRVRKDAPPGRHECGFVDREPAFLDCFVKLVIGRIAHALRVGVIARLRRKPRQIDTGTVTLQPVALNAIRSVDLLDRNIGVSAFRQREKSESGESQGHSDFHGLPPKLRTYAVRRWISLSLRFKVGIQMCGSNFCGSEV